MKAGAALKALIGWVLVIGVSVYVLSNFDQVMTVVATVADRILAFVVRLIDKAGTGTASKS